LDPTYNDKKEEKGKTLHQSKKNFDLFWRRNKLGVSRPKQNRLFLNPNVFLTW